MAKLQHVEVNINGIRHEFQMTQEEAERIGATEIKQSAPANKAKAVENK